MAKKKTKSTPRPVAMKVVKAVAPAKSKSVKTTAKKPTADTGGLSKQTAAPLPKMTQTESDRAAKKIKRRPRVSLRRPKGLEIKKLPNVYHLFMQTAELFQGHWRLFLGIGAVYGFLNLFLVQTSAGGIDLPQLRDSINEQLESGGASGNDISVGVALFGFLLGSATTPGEGVASAYQSILIIMVSLATIWALRQVQLGEKVSVRQAYYNSMQPFVPFVLIIFLIGIQFMPFVIGNFVFNNVSSNGLLVSLWDKVLVGGVYLLLSCITIYLICGSLMALYIVTLPGMTPLKAVRAARKLVRYRRFMIIRKVLFLPLLYFVIACMTLLPLIFIAVGLAEPLFFVLTIVALLFFHGYMYNLYRNLLA